MTRQLEAIKANSREFKGIPIAVAGGTPFKLARVEVDEVLDEFLFV